MMILTSIVVYKIQMCTETACAAMRRTSTLSYIRLLVYKFYYEWSRSFYYRHDRDRECTEYGVCKCKPCTALCLYVAVSHRKLGFILYNVVFCEWVFVRNPDFVPIQSWASCRVSCVRVFSLSQKKKPISLLCVLIVKNKVFFVGVCVRSTTPKAINTSNYITFTSNI